MISVLIDPIIMSIPPNSASKQEVEKWLESMELWLNEALNSPYEWLFSDSCNYILIQKGLFPNWGNLSLCGVNKNIIKLLIRKIAQIFGDRNRSIDPQIKDIEEKLKNLGYDVLAAKVNFSPEEFLNRQIDENKNNLQEILATAGACKYEGDEFGKGLKIATQNLETDCAELQIEIEVLCIRPDVALPTNNIIEESFPLIFTPESLPSPQLELLKKVRNGLDLWENRDLLFPSLDFCENVGNQLRKLLPGDMMLSPIIKRLFEFEEATKSWREGQFNYKAIGGKIRGESESTMSNKEYVALRTFVCPDGTSRVFEKHCSLTPREWRLYFLEFPEKESGKILIGYIGLHRTTTQYKF
ncbi:MAG: hypothetical protein HXX20_13355 [Chloroflexi bacterium]|nr:hypothetical protein [Chloroflexota bacterium]